MYESKTGLTTVGSIADNNGYFSTNLHKGALWFKTDVQDRTKYFINLSKKTRNLRESIVEDSRAIRYGYSVSRFRRGLLDYYYYDDNEKVRLSVFENCNSSTPLLSVIIDLQDDTFLTLEEGVGAGLIEDLSSKNSLIIAIDAPIKKAKGFGEDWQDYIVEAENGGTDIVLPDGVGINDVWVESFILALPNGGWDIAERNEEPKRAFVNFDSIQLSKNQVFSTACTYNLPVLNYCEPVSYKYGKLGHYESTLTYPDNEQLYNSKELVIDKAKITNLNLLQSLSEYKDAESEGNIILSDKADFRCKNIRHYKMPGNDISPFIYDNNLAKGSESIISPLGVFLEPEAVDNMLDIAVDNNLITQQQKDSIVEYKIYRADTSRDRSIIGSGLAFQTKKYRKDKRDVHYANFPYNMLGNDRLFTNSDGIPNKDSSGSANEFSLMQAVVPEFDYGRPALPTEMSIEGFQFGNSSNIFTEVDNHAKMVVLGRKAKDLATALAILETAAELALNLYRGSEAFRVQFGFSNSLNPVGTGLGLAVFILGALEGVASSIGRYRLEWLRAFEGLGTPYNFGYYLASTANYNYIKTIQQEGNTTRALPIRKYLPDGLIDMSDTTTGEIIRVNNIDREEAPFFYLGQEYPITNLPTEYVNYDNADRASYYASQPISSQQGCSVGKSEEFSRNVASPYVQFKNYIANQYGTIDSIVWLDTGARHTIQDRTECSGDALGGDTFISRHTKKRKTRLFNTDLFAQADNTPFPYKFYGNYGQPKYYIDFKVNSEFTASRRVFPDIFYDVRTDCGDSNRSFYLEPPSKFYLYYYGYPSFLTETRINTNFRNAQKELKSQFFPQNKDIELITQQSNVDIREQEQYYYNSAYLNTKKTSFKGLLSNTYNKENEAKKSYSRNTVMNSLPDASDNSITEPWLVYRPNDKVQLRSKNGFLTGLKGMEADQIMVFYENAMELQNPVNEFADGNTTYNNDLGGGGIFSKRALELQTTDYGYGGSQSKGVLSCEFGHFYADMQRGNIFQYLGASKRNEISRYSNEKPNGMDVWFKEHLPLKITRVLPNYSNIDNPYNGVGIHWGYDAKYRRVLLTKRDYLPLSNDYCTHNGSIFRTDNLESKKPSYIDSGYTYEGLENCQMRFEREITRTVDFEVEIEVIEAGNTDIYIVFQVADTVVADAVAIMATINTWYNNYKTANPNYTGDMYVLPLSETNYLKLPGIVHAGSSATTTSGGWGAVQVLPPNYLTAQWVPPTEVLLLSFLGVKGQIYPSATLDRGFNLSLVNEFITGSISTTAEIIVSGLSLDPSLPMTVTSAANPLTSAPYFEVISISALESLITPGEVTLSITVDTTLSPISDYGAAGVDFVINDGISTYSSSIFLADLLLDNGLANGPLQPKEEYIEDYISFSDVLPEYDYFKAVVYPDSNSFIGSRGASFLQIIAAMKGRTLTQSEITSLNTQVDVSLLLTDNPYSNLVIPNTAPQQQLRPLEELGWVGYYDKTDNITTSYTEQSFQSELNILIQSEVVTTEVIVEQRQVTTTDVLFEPLDEVSLDDATRFTDVSWTLSYRPETGGWESYMDYKPNYYITHSDYFQSGKNSNTTEFGLWSHLLTNKSYRVFYGQKYPYIIEYPEKNEYISKRLEDITWNAQLKRYHNHYDYATLQENPFTKMTVYNSFENSGNLNLIDANGTLSQMTTYPIRNADNTQDILTTYGDHKYSANYFYNRVLSNKNNEVHWIWDDNQIEKTINPLAVSFTGKKKLERMEGSFFVIRMERDANTNLDLDFKWSQQKIKTNR